MKNFAITLLLVLLYSCQNTQIFKSKKAEFAVGYLIAWKDEFLFIPSEKDNVVTFIKSNHKIGFRIEDNIKKIL